MLRKIFRDPGMSLILIINMSLIVFLLINVLNIKYQNDDALNNKTKYNYKFRENLTVYTKGTEFDESEYTVVAYNDNEYQSMFNEVLSVVEMYHGNVTYKTHCLINDKELNNLGGVDCVIKHDEDIMEDMTNGDVFVVKGGEECRGIIIPEAYKDSIYSKGGVNYIDIEGVGFVVLGFEKDYSLDHSLCGAIIYKELLDEDGKETFLKRWKAETWCDTMEFELSSNNENAKSEFEQIKKSFVEKGYTVTSMDLNAENKSDKLSFFDIDEAVSGVIYILIAIFSFINCMFVTNIWIMRKKRELVIRKTFGQSIIKILERLIMEYTIIAVVTVCISIVLQYIYAQITDEISLHFSMENIMIIGITMVVLIVINMLIPLINVAKIKPAKGLKRV